MDDKPIEVVQKYVEGIQWPAGKEEVIEALRANGAPDDDVQALRDVDKERFIGPNDVHNLLWKQA